MAARLGSGSKVGIRFRAWRRASRGEVLIFLVALLATMAPNPSPAAAATTSPGFQITLSPASQTLQPGSFVRFAVGIGSIDGFADPVTLSVSSDGPGGGLPAGVTAAFSPNPVMPPGTSFLTLTASQDAAVGSFPVIITGTGGGITNTATGQVKVDFGLSPVCYGAVEGVVTDADTGEPLAAASFNYSDVLTDADGHYRIEGIPLGEDNLPITTGVQAYKEPTYWFGDAYPVVVSCNQTTPLDFALVRVRPAQLSGRVVEGYVVPPDYSNVIPTSSPIEGASVSLYNHPTSAGPQTTAVDGSFDLGSFRVAHNNEPLDVLLQADKFRGSPDRDGYWWNSVSVHAEAGHDLVREIALVKECTGSISGRVVLAGTNLPAPDVPVVAVLGQLDGDRVMTDEEGMFSFPKLLLDYNNAPATYWVYADAGDVPFNFNVPLHQCGDHAEVELALRLQQYGSIEGRVVDEETLQPVEGALVGFPGGAPGGSFIVCPCDYTDAEGHYRLEDVFLGFEGTPIETAVTAGKDDYWGPLSPVAVTVRANETSTADDILILRRHYASMTGIVRDAITHAPIPDASVSDAFYGSPYSDLADQDGRYVLDRLQLGFRNAPRDVSVRADVPGYWPSQATVSVRADETSTQDFELLPICQDATIFGSVVNADTQEPIEGAFVSGAGLFTLTDANGEYRLEHVSVGTDNSPIQVQLSASAAGFHSQTKLITVFCGAVVQIDFGRPPVTSTIEGYVTNLTNGSPGTPMGDVFIGSGFGGSDVTDANGYYKLTDAPLNPDGSPRTWDITAIPADFVQKTDAVTVRAGETARLDFTFGEPLPDTGSLSIKKTLDAGGAGTDLPTSYSVHYDCGTGHTGDVTVAAGGGATLADGSVPFGTSCTVSEPNPPNAPAGYSFRAPTFSPSAMVTIDRDTPSITVTTNNTLTRDTGSLGLAKYLSGGPAGYTGPFTIHWDCGTFGGGDATVSATGSATVNGIPTGTQCTVSESPPSPPTGYTFGTPTFSPSDTVTITAKGATATVTTNNSLTRDTGSLHITKLVVGGGAGFTGSFDVHVVCAGDGGTYSRTIAYPTPGDVTISGIPTGNTCTVTETSRSSPPTGYTWGTLTITGSPTAAISTVTTREVTVTNTVMGRAKVIKTKGGLSLSGTDSFTFQLRQGADTSNVGTILESQNATAASGGAIDFATVLAPEQHYQVCELVMPGWNTSLAGTLFVPGSIIPPALPNPNVDNSPVCVDFVAQAGVTTTFNVDNTFPDGLARTIGFWKNWASCAKSNGGQKPVLDQTLAITEPTGIVASAQSGTYPGFMPTLYLVLHGSTATPNVAPDCRKAVNLLNKSTMTSGKKKASDPAFNLAAQLIAAELNFTAGAAKNGTVITAVNQAVVLLGKYSFTGDGYTGKISAADATTMNNLANILDNYNNNRP